jgi:ribonuclease inhibitor
MSKSLPQPRRVVIPASCASLEDVFSIFVRALRLPPHFGRNLDALYDALTGDVAGAFDVVIEDVSELEAALGAKGPALTQLLRDVAKARKDVRLMLGRGGDAAS